MAIGQCELRRTGRAASTSNPVRDAERKREADTPKTKHPAVLITSSSGFLGQAIARGLLGRYYVIGLDVRQPKKPLEGVDTLEVDLTSDESVAQAIAAIRARAGGKIASVVHLAAYYDTTGEENPKYDQVTVGGTRRLLDQLKTFETEQFVFSSTMLVHAPSPEIGVKIDEESPIDPSWAYPQSKVDTTMLLHEHRGHVKVAILRFAGVYGRPRGGRHQPHVRQHASRDRRGPLRSLDHEQGLRPQQERGRILEQPGQSHAAR